MDFNSLSFVVFLAVVLALWAALPWKVGRVFLVAASYVFYGAADPWYCLLLLLSTVVDYVSALFIAAAPDRRAKRNWLIVSVVCSLCILGTFKYGDFTIDNLNTLLGWIGLVAFPLPGFILPVGISFYTFQTMSYTIDVYREKVEPTRDFLSFALYVAYFPQLVAGPIERAGSLLPQLLKKQNPTPRDFELGFQRILVGFIKKVVLADRVAVMVDQVYSSPSDASAPVILLAVFGFALQLYLDFSAYTDIAIGAARLMGVRLRENFDAPMLATNPPDFWARWHMSLTTWFTDYVFQPLLRSFKSRTAQLILGPVIVMGLVGLWHGASWNYVYFGILNGLGIVVYRSIRRSTGRRFGLFGKGRLVTILATLLCHIYVNFTVVFFRSPDLKTAFAVLSGAATGSWTWDDRYTPFLGLFIAIWAFIIVFEKFIRPRGEIELPGPVRGTYWFGLIMLILFGAVDRTERFVYFQF